MGKIMPTTISFNWPGLDNEKKGFLISFEVKVSALIGFILIMMHFCRPAKIPKSKVFQQFLVGPVPVVPDRQRWQLVNQIL